METKNLTESDSVTLQLVRESETKKVTIISAGAMTPNKEGIIKFKCIVEIDAKQKGYMPNKTTLKLLQAAYGTESTVWVGKTLNLSIGSVLGKEAIIGTPI